MGERLDFKTISSYVQEYNELRSKAKTIKARMDALAKTIKEHLTSTTKPDSKGNYYLEDESFVFGNQAKKSVKLNEAKATEFFKAKGLLEKVVDVKTVINEDKVSKLLETGDLTQQELEALVDIKVTYSIDIKEKVKEQEEEIVEVQVASKTKPSRKLPIRR